MTLASVVTPYIQYANSEQVKYAGIATNPTAKIRNVAKAWVMLMGVWEVMPCSPCDWLTHQNGQEYFLKCDVESRQVDHSAAVYFSDGSPTGSAFCGEAAADGAVVR